jgi:predicted GIY-YIG superfamily endonuclease
MSKSKRDYQDDSSSSNGDRKERRKLSSSRADEDGWSVYVLRNSKTGEIYTGCTNDLNARLSIHQTHPTRGARTTRRWVAKHGSDVVTIFAQVGPMTKSAAHSLEHKWKRTNGSGAAIEV